MENKKVSFVVPVYNVKKYLRKCVDSLTGQTYQNIEVILVDDGSSDGSSLLCDELAQNDQRIVVIHKPNTGVSDTRNVGINKSTGDYVAFVDSDDFVSPKFVEYMLNAAEQNNLDMVACGFKRVHEKNKKDVFKYIKHKPVEVFSSEQYMLDLFTGNILAKCIAGGKMYRKNKLVGKFMDTELTQGEDVMFNYDVLKDIDSVGFIKEPLYGYLCRDDSAVKSRYAVRRFVFMHKLDKILDETQDEKLYNAIGTWLYFSALESFYLMWRDRVKDVENYKYLRQLLKKTTPCLRKNKDAYLSRRIFAPIGIELMNIFIKKK